MHDNIDKKPSPTSGDQDGSDCRLNDALNLIADRIDILASKYDKTEAEKDREKAESERKKIHDDRTYRRQGWAITVAAVALGLNFISLVGLGVQSLNARNAVEVAQQTLAMNSRPAIAFSNMAVSTTGNNLKLRFSTENKSSGVIYVYGSFSSINEVDQDEVYENLREMKQNNPISQIFPGHSDSIQNSYHLASTLSEKDKGKKYYVTFNVFSSSFGQERFIVSECEVFTWDGMIFTTDGLLCKHNQRYEALDDYLTSSSNKQH